MRLNHNKKRNTAFLYEVLIKELSAAAINENIKIKQKALKLLKEYFSKGRVLNKELEIYKSFNNLSDFDQLTIDKILFEAKKQFFYLDKRKIYSDQSKLINEINKNFGKDSWNIFVANFKNIATINQILNQKLSPRDQVLLEEKLHSDQHKQKPEKQNVQKIDKLTVKKFVERFNNEYAEKLNETQRNLLNRYITSYRDDGLEFKVYLYEEVDRLKKILEEKVVKADKQTSEKLSKVIEKTKNYSSRTIGKDLLSEIMTIQSLVSELTNSDN